MKKTLALVIAMVMYLGKCVERATSDELFANPRHPYTKALLSAIPVPDISMRNKEIHLIQGEVTSPINPKPGCRFAACCPMARPECSQESVKCSKIVYRLCNHMVYSFDILKASQKKRKRWRWLGRKGLWK
jgi:oligopeptide/dipeptide ABC transporter ATP-binding protein